VRARRGLIYILAGALVLALIGLLLPGRETRTSYADQLRGICKRAYEPLKTTGGNYFENVVGVSALKYQALSSLEPPRERAAVHRELISREQQLSEQAIAARDRIAQALAVGGHRAVDPAEFPTLRAAQAELDGWYRSVGVEHCSD
jgi:hypothetical protein